MSCVGESEVMILKSMQKLYIEDKKLISSNLRGKIRTLPQFVNLIHLHSFKA